MTDSEALRLAAAQFGMTVVEAIARMYLFAGAMRACVEHMGQLDKALVAAKRIIPENERLWEPPR